MDFEFDSMDDDHRHMPAPIPGRLGNVRLQLFEVAGGNILQLETEDGHSISTYLDMAQMEMLAVTLLNNLEDRGWFEDEDEDEEDDDA